MALIELGLDGFESFTRKELIGEITRLRQQVATLTEQRDLAVTRLELIATAEESDNAMEYCQMIARFALAAIQSAEVTK